MTTTGPIALKLTALVLGAVILVPAGAHLFELPGKIDLGRDAYFTVQQIYAGWSAFGIPLVAAVLVNGALFLVLRRHDRLAARSALAAAALVAASLAVFFVWTFPANQATANWTMMTDDWAMLRRRWEYAHAAGALLVFAAFVATAVAALRR